MLFFDSNSWLLHHDLNKEIEKLEQNRTYYLKEIHKDEQLIQKLQDTNELEKFARRKYFMKKKNEDIYIIEYQNENQ